MTSTDDQNEGASGFECDVIVVGTDGSPEAATAVAWAGGLAARIGATVVAVHAVGLLDHLPGEHQTVSIDIRDQIQALLESEWTQVLRDLGVDHRCVMEDGPPLLAIPRVAQREGGDLIVVASHGKGRASALLLGSTSHGLAQMAELPVVILPTR